MKLHNDTQCDVSRTSVYRQRRDVGVGCLVGVVADREPLGSSRDYSFVLGSGEADCDYASRCIHGRPACEDCIAYDTILHMST